MRDWTLGEIWGLDERDLVGLVYGGEIQACAAGPSSGDGLGDRPGVRGLSPECFCLCSSTLSKVGVGIPRIFG